MLSILSFFFKVRYFIYLNYYQQIKKNISIIQFWKIIALHTLNKNVIFYFFIKMRSKSKVSIVSIVGKK